MATLRRPAPARAGSAARGGVPLPADVRLMNAVATAVFVLAAAGAGVAAWAWLMRSPWFPIRAIQLDGDLARNSLPTIRANATPRLAGNFFSVDLQQSRAAFESVPWVRRAVVRRVWPDRLQVRLEEHHSVALWAGEEPLEAVDTGRLVNSFGEVFDANVGDVEDEALPVLSGPEARAAEMLTMLQRLRPLLARHDLQISALHLSGRGSWRAAFDSGATMELGRGSDDEVVARTERFVRTFAAANARWRAPLLHADLRHPSGYALRLRDVTPTPGAAATAGATN
ncbi:MAG: cell division protein FtsQ/DivIB [Burkholderiaceae bacterium]|jgi:cell division protein FtsQ|nr:cell division protein FtsQ/DivIB [Burkholderiaceae bacterium]MCZ8174631.1 cell division protein FtsQ/DivIB [Burkholderiaceae bacterium]